MKHFTTIIQLTEDNQFIPAIFAYDSLDEAKSKAYSELGYAYSEKVLKKCIVCVQDEQMNIEFTDTYEG
jgi:hypothetical protein